MAYPSYKNEADGISHHPVVFIDSKIDDYQSLVNGAIPQAEVIVLDPTVDGVSLVTSQLRDNTDARAIHIVAHGAPGCLDLGNSKLSLDTLESITRISVADDGTEGNSGSGSPAISADGRFVAFSSSASNLVAEDTNNQPDIFVRDFLTGTNTLVSVANDGTQGNRVSSNPAISADGRFVAFDSFASNLVEGDTNFSRDVFVRDLLTGTTTRVSVANDGTQANISPTLFTPPISANPAISADGRFVAFVSDAVTLVAGDTNGRNDIFVRDIIMGTTTRVSVADDGTQGNSGSGSDFAFGKPAISGDGRFVAFLSTASNLVASDTNNRTDIFVRDLQMSTTIRVSVADDGTQGNNNSGGNNEPGGPVISGDGRFVAFTSFASNFVAEDTNNLPDLFLHDLLTGTTTRVSVANDGTQADSASFLPAISADGSFVAFSSFARNLVASDTNNSPDIFVRDLQMGTTTRLSVADDGTEGNNTSWAPAISADGRFVAFDSSASNLVASDTNNSTDVFIREINNPLNGFNDTVTLGANINGTSDNDHNRSFMDAETLVTLIGVDPNTLNQLFTPTAA